MAIITQDKLFSQVDDCIATDNLSEFEVTVLNAIKYQALENTRIMSKLKVIEQQVNRLSK